MAVSYRATKLNVTRLICQIVTGSSTPNLKTLREKLNMPRPMKFDMVFLDHLKPLYTIDLKVMEEEGLVGVVSTQAHLCPDYGG